MGVIVSYIEAGKELIRKIESNGFEAFFVGGFVRDFIMNQKCNDIDITTNAKPKDIINIFEQTYQKGIKYNSVVVVYLGYEFEVTTYRLDLDYVDNRHPIIGEALSLEEDLKRRDFTINSIAMDKNNNLIDYHNGLLDIENKVIKAVGNANLRFKEDALRMLRACYFAGKLNFKIEDKTFEAIKEDAHLISNISSERVYAELAKLLSSKYSLNGLKYLYESKLCSYIPKLKVGVSAYLNNSITLNDMLLFLTTCFYDSIEELNYYKLSNVNKKYIISLINCMKVLQTNKYTSYDLYNYGKEICLKSNMLGSKLGLFLDSSSQIENIFDNIQIKSDLDINISLLEVNNILNDWKKSRVLFENIRKEIVNNNINNTKEDIIIYINELL